MATSKKNPTGGGGKLVRSEIVTVRLDPKLKYLVDLAARKQRRTVSSFVEWAVESMLEREPIYKGEGYNGDVDISFAQEARRLWDVDESERFIKLAIHYPELLTHEEQERWKMLTDSKLLTPARTRTPAGTIKWDPSMLDDVVFPAIRSLWNGLLNAHAAGPSQAAQWVEAQRKAVEAGFVYPKGAVASAATKSGFEDMDDDIPF